MARVSDLMQAMADAGAPMEAILIAVKALEERDDTIEQRRAADRERKRRQRSKGRDSHGTVTGQSEDAAGPLDKENPPTPPKENNPSPPIVPPKRAKTLAKPDDVSEQVWADWTDLRRKKRATITASVVQSARAEAAQLGWTLERFLAEWIFRGSQGLKAEWVAKEGRRAPANDSSGFLAHVIERKRREQQQAAGP